MTDQIVDDIGRINKFLRSGHGGDAVFSVDEIKQVFVSLCRVVIAHETVAIQVEWPRDFITILGSLDMSDDARTVVNTLLCKAVDAGKSLARSETAR